MRHLILILCFLFIISCNVNDSEESDQIVTAPVSAQKIDKLIINGNAIIADVIYSTSTPCWTFARIEQSQSDSTFTAKVFARSNRSQICPQVIDSILVKHSIYFPSAGVKTLKFWQYDSTYLDTTVVVKN